MLTIENENIIRELRRIADSEKRSIEDVLKTMLDTYTPDLTRQVLLKAYQKARDYWHAMGDENKAMLSDETLDELFGAFDEQGVPRLKSELPEMPPRGSLAYAAKVAEQYQLTLNDPALATQSREILDEHFANDLQGRVAHDESD